MDHKQLHGLNWKIGLAYATQRCYLCNDYLKAAYFILSI
jgi:hypothetical protein